VSFALDVALDWYLKRDLAIFPCKEKKPLIGTGFKAASKDPEQVKKWWTTWPAAQLLRRSSQRRSLRFGRCLLVPNLAHSIAPTFKTVCLISRGAYRVTSCIYAVLSL
jgi:hypothetical protein